MQALIRRAVSNALGILPTLAIERSDDSLGVEPLLLAGAQRFGAVLFFAIVVVDAFALRSGIASRDATLLYDGATLLGVAFGLACVPSRIGARWPDAPLFLIATVMNISLVFGAARLNQVENEIGLLCVAMPVAVAAFAPLHPTLMFVLGLEVVMLHPIAARVVPPGWNLDFSTVSALALAIAAIGASASRSQRAVWSGFARAHTRALEATRMKSGFLADVSHEIRSPMTAIMGFADELARKLGALGADSEAFDDLHTIQRNGAQLLELINGILDLSKIEAGKLSVESVPCSAVAIVAEVVHLLGPQARVKGLRLESRCDGRIPTAICSDPSRLRQIVTNLVQNAIKFTVVGEVRVILRLTVKSPAAEPWLEITVEDTGLGISLADQQRIFEPFTQVNGSTTRAFPGTGLGLSLSRRLAHLLGGEIEFASAPGQGSRFTLRIATGPVGELEHLGADETTLATEPSDRGQSTGDQRRLRGSVLVAEDGVDNQRLLRAILGGAGLQIEVVGDGEQACRRVSDSQRLDEDFDVVLMDMQMPILDGYAATRRLRAAGYRGAIIALTAHAMAGDRERCLAAGCDDYATKPIIRADLLARISASIEKRRAQRP